MDEKILKKLKERIEPYFLEKGGHGFDHTERVYNNALKISKGEKIDLDVIKLASLLHDVARHREDIGEVNCHAEEGAKMAEIILRELKFPEEKIKKVIYAIEVHRYSKNIKPKTKEAAILQDADRLDALGAICIARVFSYNGKKGKMMYDPKIKPNKEYKGGSKNSTALNHFYEKILKIKPNTFKTKKAREIAKERYKFVEEFLKRFVEEWEGKK